MVSSPLSQRWLAGLVRPEKSIDEWRNPCITYGSFFPGRRLLPAKMGLAARHFPFSQTFYP
jgi:hypothetical protein